MECRRFSQTMASEWQTAFDVSQIPRCALLTAVKNYNKSLEELQDFLQDRDQDQMFKTKNKTSCMTQDQDQDYHFVLGASRPRPWSRGLRHCVKH